jgi:hypothetical protein
MTRQWHFRLAAPLLDPLWDDGADSIIYQVQRTGALATADVVASNFDNGSFIPAESDYLVYKGQTHADR